jgi:hypothetical protein
MLIDLEDIISDRSYEEIVKLFERIDDIQADSVFTDMVLDAFMARKREMDNAG